MNSWNIELSQALYPSLQAVEVSLRNSIHTAASIRYQSEYWFDHANVLLPAQASKIRDARSDLARLGKPLTAGRIVAALSFGFWVQLFNRPYERVPRNAPSRLSWHDNDLAMFDAAFPNAPRRVRNREAMRRQCEAIRDLRNRVFHYEPVWYQPSLKRQHANILDMIGWISPQMRSTVGLCDHFTLTHEGGRADRGATEAPPGLELGTDRRIDRNFVDGDCVVPYSSFSSSASIAALTISSGSMPA